MGADTINVTEEAIAVAKRGIMIQLGASDLALEFDSLEDAIEHHNMWGFIDNQAKVIATHQAWHTYYQRIMP